MDGSSKGDHDFQKSIEILRGSLRQELNDARRIASLSTKRLAIAEHKWQELEEHCNSLREEVERVRRTVVNSDSLFQTERRRVLFYADRLSASEKGRSEVERRKTEIEGQRNGLAEQVDAMRQRLTELEHTLSEIQESHGYKLLRVYIRVHDHPILGAPIRVSKQIVRRLK